MHMKSGYVTEVKQMVQNPKDLNREISKNS